MNRSQQIGTLVGAGCLLGAVLLYPSARGETVGTVALALLLFFGIAVLLRTWWRPSNNG